MIDKTTTIEDATGRIPDGATVTVGGFGVPDTRFCLIDELAQQGRKGLTLRKGLTQVKNLANKVGMGIDRLPEKGHVERLIVSPIERNSHAIGHMNEGRLTVEFWAQGILAERIRRLDYWAFRPTLEPIRYWPKISGRPAPGTGHSAWGFWLPLYHRTRLFLMHCDRPNGRSPTAEVGGQNHQFRRDVGTMPGLA